MTGPVEQAANPTQHLVSRARAAVLQGRGPGAPPDEKAHAQHLSDLLGALPAPVERELVHLATELARGRPDGSILEALRQQADELVAHWPAPPEAVSARLTRAWTD
ncbi:hypothetical protein [Nocardia vaccinii]|uniref:hypothetical protein n=1 Tax=Nocardia vaccinii TaxID=1822 RepID=UPI00082B0FD4|nr:hypothetical protein [Nocardia vaccinii]